MGEVLLVLMIMVLSTVIAQYHRDQFLFKPESSSHIKETTNLWTHAFENEILNGLANQGIGLKHRRADNKKNSQLSKKTQRNPKLNYDLLTAVLKTATSKDIKPHALNSMSKPLESNTRLSYTHEIPLSTSKSDIWGSKSHGLDSGIISIAALDMRHGLREFGLV